MTQLSPELRRKMAQTLRNTPETLRHRNEVFGPSGICACGVIYAVLQGQTVEELIKARPEDENVVYVELGRVGLRTEKIFGDNDDVYTGKPLSWPEMADKLLRGEYDVE